MGNRPNEHYAEMTVCLYLPDGRVGFMFKRPHIEGHVAHDAGGLRFDVLEPYEEHHVTYDGNVCLLVNPREMADPGTAFKNNPHEECSIDLRLTAASEPSGGEPTTTRAKSRRRASRTPSRGTPSSRWRSPASSTWTGSASTSTGRSASATTRGDRACGRASGGTAGSPPASTAASASRAPCVAPGRPRPRNVNGRVFDVDRYGDGRVVKVRDMQLTSEYDDEWFVQRSDVVITTDDHAYELHGEVSSSIPLRNRRDGMVTRLTEGMTRWTVDDREGAGLSEYLDQVVDDVPVGTSVGI